MTMSVIGQPLLRVDGRAKVTGSARYAAEFNQSGQAYAAIVSATIGLGRIASIDSRSASDMPGIVAVITHLNALHLPYGSHKRPIDPASACKCCRTIEFASTVNRSRSSSPRPSTRLSTRPLRCASYIRPNNRLSIRYTRRHKP